MIARHLENEILYALETRPVVVLTGPRQVGKTTLALQIASQNTSKPAHYLDLELDSDFNKLSDPENYLRRFENQLLIIDEVQREPDLYRILRGLVDIRKRKDEKAGHFLLLGSAAKDLLQKSSESLAGRIRYLELSPFSVLELYQDDNLGFSIKKLWFRGGFPDSYLAGSDEESWDWRVDFIASYVERDIPLMGPDISPSRMKTFWTMLAYYHGQQIVLSEIGKSLGVSHTTIRFYLDTLVEFYMVREVPPWSGNVKKRLIKSPKVYIRDSGIFHKLLNITDFDSLLGHPKIGASWEGLVIENIITHLSDKWKYSYYRTTGQLEIDLVLEGSGGQVWAIEIKRSSVPRLAKSFYTACADIKATNRFVIYNGSERYPLPGQVEALGLVEFLKLLD